MKIVIVGGGISGLATAHALLHRDANLAITLYEATERCGGKIGTDQTTEGFLCESGVNGFLDNKPRTLELAAALGLTPLRSNDDARRRFIAADGELQQLPESPLSFFTSHLLSLRGRLRILAEPFIARGNVDDETLANFAARRLGKEAFEKLIDPMASGVFAGDATRLSLKSCFPRIHDVEQEYGSLIRGLLKLQVKALAQGGKEHPSAGPGGTLSSFANGMGELSSALRNHLGKRLRLGTAVQHISPTSTGYEVHTTAGKEEADKVILAAPAFVQADILTDMAPDVAHLLRDIPYPSVSVCCFGYKRERIKHQLRGFGFLIPSKEGRRILGSVWDSSVFPHRAPEGYVLLRTLVGGARRPELALLPDAKLVDVVSSELAATMGIQVSPDFVRIYRHDKAIPQYEVGHAARLHSLETAMSAFPGLMLTGNAFHGVSLNDCVANAQRTADKTLISSG